MAVHRDKWSVSVYFMMVQLAYVLQVRRILRECALSAHMPGSW